MKNNVAILISLVAFLTALGSIALQLQSKPLGDGIDKYSFADPLEALKSKLQMDVNQDYLAEFQLSHAITVKKNSEKLQTIKVNKTREYKGSTLLFIEYNEAGLPKREIVGMEKDASTGYWSNVYVSTYFVEKENPALAAEMKEWKPDN